MEDWRDIPGFEGYYQASILGQIKTVPHFRNAGNGWGFMQKEKVLTPKKGNTGYLRVVLSKNSTLYNFSVHRLVALTFPEICGTTFPGAVVNHLNEDKTDNRAENLRWCTQKENINWGTGIKRRRKTNINGKCSKPILQYTKTGEFVAEYPSQSEAARQTGFSQGNISSCCKGLHKEAYGYLWEYKY